MIELTDEQSDFVDAVRDFCRRECGTREQRDALTDGGQHPHNPDLYTQDGRARLARRRDRPRSTAAPAAAWSTCACSSRRPRAGMAPIGGFGVSVDRRRRVRALRHRGAEAGDPRRHRRRRASRRSRCPSPRPARTSARCAARPQRQNGGYVVNGQKTWISEAHLADHILLVCRTDRERLQARGPDDAQRPRRTPRAWRSARSRRWAARSSTTSSSPTATSPADRLLGDRGQGAGCSSCPGLNVERLILAALMLGIAQRAFDDALAYVKEREQFGRPIGSFQALKHRIADLATEIECCRLLTYDVAATVDANPGAMFPREASMAKLKVTETAKRVALEGMQMMGGYGYATEYDMEGHVRHDARLDDLRRHERDPARHHREDVRAVSRQAPPELSYVLGHFGLKAGNANVIMQLSRLPVGHGVARSTVDSGRVDKHPIKRLRTTVSYLAVCDARHRGGTPRDAPRGQPGAHAPCTPSRPTPSSTTRSTRSSSCGSRPACTGGRRTCSGCWASSFARRGPRRSTSTPSAWARRSRSPTTCGRPTGRRSRSYWEEGLRQVEMDDVTRGYLQSIAQLEFLTAPLGPLGAPLRPLLRPYGRFLTLGYLPEQFRQRARPAVERAPPAPVRPAHPPLRGGHATLVAAAAPVSLQPLPARRPPADPPRGSHRLGHLQDAVGRLRGGTVHSLIRG